MSNIYEVKEPNDIMHSLVGSEMCIRDRRRAHMSNIYEVKERRIAKCQKNPLLKRLTSAIPMMKPLKWRWPRDTFEENKEEA